MESTSRKRRRRVPASCAHLASVPRAEGDPLTSSVFLSTAGSTKKSVLGRSDLIVRRRARVVTVGVPAPDADEREGGAQCEPSESPGMPHRVIRWWRMVARTCRVRTTPAPADNPSGRVPSRRVMRAVAPLRTALWHALGMDTRREVPIGAFAGP